jgi:hypothetical protein
MKTAKKITNTEMYETLTMFMADLTQRDGYYGMTWEEMNIYNILKDAKCILWNMDAR